MASANTTYNVNLTDISNTNTLTGTITTNGTIGPLLASDFLGFSFTDIFTGNPNFTFSVNGSSVACSPTLFGCGFTTGSYAGTNYLFFDNNAGDGNQAEFSSSDGKSIFSISNAYQGSWLFQEGTKTQSVTFAPRGNLLVASVPEPQTYVMFLSGLCIMGLIARRRRKS
jgi:hypothetical protein